MAATLPEDPLDRRLRAALIALVVLGPALAQAWLVSHYRTLPGTIFGTDVYYQLGCIHSIRASFNPMASCSACGGIPGYLPLYGTLIALFSFLTRLDPIPAVLVASVLLKALSIGIAYLVFRRLHGPTVGILFAALWSVLFPDAAMRYTEFTTEILVPLNLFALHRLLERPGPARALVVGLLLALTGYAHAVAFVGGVLIAGLALVLDAGAAGIAGAPGFRLRDRVVSLAIVLASLSLALGYWYRPIFVYHGHLSTHYIDWNRESTLISFAEQWLFAKRVAVWAFRVSWTRTLLNLGALAGALIALRRVREPIPRASLIVAVATFVAIFHYFATEPLLHTNFVPEYMVMMLWSVARLFPGALFVGTVLARPPLRAAAPALAVLAVALALVHAVMRVRATLPDRTSRLAVESLPTRWGQLAAYVRTHTDPEDVFLSTNELSFALSALTGRKVLVTRRGQNDPYLDMDVRNRDAALILYGRDPDRRRQRLARWGIDYVLWTRDWGSSNWLHLEQPTPEAFDPLLWFENPAADSEVVAAGVDIEHRVTWVDPNIRYPRVRKFPLTLVTARNDTRFERPWRPELDARLERVWSCEENGQPAAALYRVRP